MNYSEVKYIAGQIRTIEKSVEHYKKERCNWIVFALISEVIIGVIFIAMGGFRITSTFLSALLGFACSYFVGYPLSVIVNIDNKEYELIQKKNSMIFKAKCYGYEYLIDKILNAKN